MTDAVAPDGFIPAATILLLRDEPTFEVLMIERNANIAFAGGALVFPGGRIDPGDGLKDWRSHCDGLDSFPDEEFAPRVASIREAFEETGILLARDQTGELINDAQAAALGPWRAVIEEDDSQFIEMIRTENLRLACDLLHLFARWQPPAEATHKRFHTWFFAARAPQGQKAREDGNEATDAFWTSPQAAIDARACGDRYMIFPTARNVELLALQNSVNATFKDAKGRKIVPIEPHRFVRDGKSFIGIPEGLGYPVLEEDLKTAFRR